jgi:hypothetical protein
MNFGLIFIKNNRLLSVVIGCILVYIITLIPGDVWLTLFFLAALAGERR